MILYENIISYEIDDRVEIIALNWKRKMGLYSRIKCWKQLRGILKDKIVISFLYSAIRDVVISTVFTKTKLVFSERNDPNNDPPGKIRKIVRNISYYFADAIVFQTEDQRNYFSNFIRKKGRIIFNPVKDDLPLCGPIKKKIVVSVCRLAEQKNLKMAVDAFKLFYSLHSDYIYNIYGEGELQDNLVAYIKSIGLEGKINLMGFKQKVHDEIKDAKMYISSSNYEGISNSMLEAMAIGLPVICTDCPIGGSREVIRSGDNGLLVPVGDTKKLYIAMNKVADNNGFATFLSKNAVKVRHTYSKERICEQWEQLIIKTGRKNDSN